MYNNKNFTIGNRLGNESVLIIINICLIIVFLMKGPCNVTANIDIKVMWIGISEIIGEVMH